MMLMIFMSLFIVIARDLPHCDAINFLDHGLSMKGIITSTVASLSQSIKDAGLDPLRGAKQTINNTKIIPFNITIMEFSSDGLSNIVVNEADFSIFSTTFDFDIEMPAINMTLGNTSISANVLKNLYTVEAGAKIVLKSIRFVGKVKFTLAISSGVKVEEFKIHFSLGDFKPDVNLVIQGDDYSSIVNMFLKMIPAMITHNSALIDEALAKFLLNYVTNLLTQDYLSY